MGTRAAGRIASDYLIMARRREEDARRLYETTRKSNWDMKFNAEWEIRTAASIENKKIDGAFQGIRRQDQLALEGRRRRLASMLQEEQAKFQRELEALEKTPEERKNDMMARARALKQMRETERQKYVREQYDRQWRMGCDALREADSVAIMKACDAARGYQIAEKMDSLEMEEQENRIFDELWEQDRLRKLQREEEEEAMRKQMDQEQTRARALLRLYWFALTVGPSAGPSVDLISQGLAGARKKHQGPSRVHPHSTWHAEAAFSLIMDAHAGPSGVWDPSAGHLTEVSSQQHQTVED